jgi:hypothetical protein
MERRVILMANKASPSETLAWCARRVARMLSPRDAQLAEAYAVECEDQAREASGGLRSARSALVQSVGNPIPNSTRGSPKQLLYCED